MKLIKYRTRLDDNTERSNFDSCRFQITLQNIICLCAMANFLLHLVLKIFTYPFTIILDQEMYLICYGILQIVLDSKSGPGTTL